MIFFFCQIFQTICCDLSPSLSWLVEISKHWGIESYYLRQFKISQIGNFHYESSYVGELYQISSDIKIFFNRNLLLDILVRTLGWNLILIRLRLLAWLGKKCQQYVENKPKQFLMAFAIFLTQSPFSTSFNRFKQWFPNRKICDCQL